MIGNRFEAWTVLSDAGLNNDGACQYRTVCTCGSEHIRIGALLRNGTAEPCGCSVLPYKHGMSRDGMWRTWYGMIDRCANPKSTSYKNYGGRGITVCSSWLESFVSFYSDMGDKPTPKHSIDRIDNDGDYTPDNCKWSTRPEQQRNQRKRKSKLGVTGVLKQLNETYSAYITSDSKLTHLGTFNTLEEAKVARKDGELKYWGKS